MKPALEKLWLCRWVAVALALASWAPATDATPTVKSETEVLKIIAGEGATEPAWLASTPLKYPPTLDLTWAQPPKGGKWDANKWLGQHVWSSINENPPRWKGGIKLMYKVLDVNKDDPAKKARTCQTLGMMYFNYFKDYARAAYWWKQAQTCAPGAIKDDPDQPGLDILLGICYHHLGNSAMARKMVERFQNDDTRRGDLIQAWAVFGELDRSLKLAETRIRSQSPDVGWLLAGDVLRAAERYDEALKYYDLFLKNAKGALKGDAKHNRERAQDGMDTIKYFNLFDLTKVPDGTFKGSATGYRGPVEAVVTVQKHKITDVKVNHKEDQAYSSVTDMPAAILAKQSVKGISATSGATMTANAIVMGAAKALGDAAANQ